MEPGEPDPHLDRQIRSCVRRNVQHRSRPDAPVMIANDPDSDTWILVEEGYAIAE